MKIKFTDLLYYPWKSYVPISTTKEMKMPEGEEVVPEVPIITYSSTYLKRDQQTPLFNIKDFSWF